MAEPVRDLSPTTVVQAPCVVEMDQRWKDNTRITLRISGEDVYVEARRNRDGDLVITVSHPMLEDVRLQRADGKAVIGIFRPFWPGA